MNEGVSGGDQALAFIYLLGCLILVMSGLAVRRAPIGKMLKMALAWVLIFAAGFAIFALREDFSALGSRIWAAARGGGGQQVVGREVRIAMADGGHFFVEAEINGQPIELMIDSGATMTSLNRATADRLGIVPDGRIAQVRTGDGLRVMDRGRTETLKVGSIERSGLGVLITRADSPNVIGMNFLSSLSGWSIENRTLVLRP